MRSNCHKLQAPEYECILVPSARKGPSKVDAKANGVAGAAIFTWTITWPSF